MRIKFDDGDMVQESKFLGEGEHIVTITSATIGKSQSGKDMLTVEFTAPNGKTCKDWFVLEFKRKLHSLALASGATPGLLKSGEWEEHMLLGKKVVLIRSITGKRPYVDKEGVAREGDKFENAYAPVSAKNTNPLEQNLW